MIQSQPRPQPENCQVLKISLAKDSDGAWTTVNRGKSLGPSGSTRDVSGVSKEAEDRVNAVSTVAENVSSFLSGIRATFRSENVLVSNTQSQSKSSKRSGLEIALNVNKQ